MKSFIKNIIYKNTDRILKIPIEKYRRLQKQQTVFSIEEKRKHRFSELKHITEYALKNTNFYPKHIGKTSIDHIQSENDFAQIPTINKKDIIAGKNQITAGEKHLSIASSGSTGDASSISMSTQEAGAKFGIYLSVLEKCGFNKGDRIFQFYPKQYQTKMVDIKGSIRQMFSTYLQNKIAHDLLTNRKVLFYDNAFISENALTDFALTIASDINKNSNDYIIFARADFLTSFVWHLKKYNIPLPQPKAVITCGTLISETMALKIKKHLQCPLFNLYGCSEVSFMALSEQNTETVNTLGTGVYMEIEKIPQLKNYHTDAGEIIVTDLRNKTMPLIRYRTGDIGVKTAFDTFKILGRKKNIITIKDKVFTEYDLLEIFFNEDIPYFIFEHFEQNNYLHILKETSLSNTFKKHVWNLGVDNLQIYKENKIEFLDKFNYIKTDTLPEPILKPEAHNTACVICGNYTQNIIFDNNIQRILKCAKCSFLTTTPLNDVLYKKQKNKDIEILATNLKYHMLKAQTLLKRIQKQHSKKSLRNMNVLDIGCGNASLYPTLKNHSASYYGIEPDKTLYTLAKKIFPDARIENTDLINAKGLPNQIDIIILSHTLEHIKNPKRLLNHCFKILKPGGMIYIEVPSDGNAITISKIKKVLRINTDTPTNLDHLNLFTMNTLKKITVKSGFRKIKFKKITRFGDKTNIITALGNKKMSFKIKAIFYFFFFTRLDIFLRQGYITLTARKPVYRGLHKK